MTKLGRILIVDDSELWREELVEILVFGGFHVDAVSGAAQALQRLKETFYHLLVLDIRMDENDPGNIDGVNMLRNLDKLSLDEATKVIMLSAYATPEQMRTAFKEYKVADFLSKDTFQKEEFLADVRALFARDININLALEVNWQQVSGPEQAVLNLEVDGTIVGRNTPLQAQMAVELDDLLRRMFCQAESILVKPLTAGRSGTGVLWVQPFYPVGGGHVVVVKFGQFRKIEAEHHNFDEYIKPFVGGARTTTILTVRRTSHLGGIVYSLLGAADDSWEDFGSFYHRADISQIKQALNQLFLHTCSAWYASPGRLHLHNLTSDYQRLFSYTPEKLEPAVSEHLSSVQISQEIHFNALSTVRAFTNPMLATAGQSFARPTYVCTTHGDFNHHNILVDGTGYMWLIDFQGTGPGHILRDVSTLDSVIRFQLLTDEDATLDECLAMEEALCSIEHFSEVELLETRFQTTNQALGKAYATVVHLRTIARKLVAQNPHDDISEYSIALLYNALSTLRFYSLSQRQREHALLCASLLVDQLGLRM